jgi:hypothetical protein
MSKAFALFLILMCCSVTARAADAISAGDLRCEYWEQPSNVDLPHPRLSWILSSPQRGADQKAYQILVASTGELLAKDQGDLWDSGKVDSDQTIQIPYAGKPLASGQQCFWKVRVWNSSSAEPSSWSTPASWSMGLLSGADWKARWIGVAGATVEGDGSALGYHAAVSHRADDTKWVQVDLGQPRPIDSVKLDSMNHESPGFGFPVRFMIAASDDPDFKSSQVIADDSGADVPNPGAVAVAFKARGVNHRYVRVTATRLFHRTAGDKSYCFALAQLEVISNGKNVALHAPVTALDSTEGYGWGKDELTDGLRLAPDETTPSAIKTMPIFRKSITATKPVSRAVIFICGLGQYELSLNGSKVGNDLLQPGWTDYRKTCLYQCYDLTGQFKTGANLVGVMLGNGMYDVQGVPGRYTKFTGSMGPPQVIAQLQITYKDGSSETIGTDNTWQVAGGPVTFSSIYGGEDYDARLENPAESSWQSAIELNGPGGKLTGVSRSAPPITVAQVLKPRQITHPRSDCYVYDMGQNCAQMPAITVTGASGATIRLTPGEVLKGDGTVSQQSSGGPTYYSYTLRGGGSESWSPRFTYCGSRYLQVNGAVPQGSANPSNLPVIHDLRGLFITSSSPTVGEFSCSSPLFNQTAEIIRWAMRNNLMSVLTDCPHRERLGWLEETHLVGPSLMYNLQIPSLFTKVCGDITDTQTASGLCPDIAPEYAVFSGGFRDSPEWGSASLLIPWQIYQWYGDKEILDRHYQTMQRYVQYLRSSAKDGILPGGLGDWYDLGPNAPGYAQLTPISLTATAFYYRDLCILAQAAKLLGHDDDASSDQQLAEQVREAFNRAFYHADTHSYSTGSQTANALPLVFGMPPQADRPAIVENIVADIRKRHDGLTAGDIGYRYLLRALAEGGRSDVVFDMNSRSDRPGYGMILAKGATSLTEAWDARPDSSQDHFMLGHIMEWFYGDLAGIQPDPTAVGFKKILFRPQPVGNITWAKASYKSIRGTIQSSWKTSGSTFSLDVTIPPGCTATVVLPAKFSHGVTEGGKPVADEKEIAVMDHSGAVASFEVPSGSYHFESHLK